MWVYVCVYAQTHTNTAQMGYSVVSPGIGMRHLEDPVRRIQMDEYIYIRKCVQSTHVYVYARRRDEILDFLLFSLASFFLSKKNKSKRCERKPPIISKVKYMIWAHRSQLLNPENIINKFTAASTLKNVDNQNLKPFAIQMSKDDGANSKFRPYVRIVDTARDMDIDDWRMHTSTQTLRTEKLTHSKHQMCCDGLKSCQ